ncbi:hypothetical protein HYH03_010001 [Edaphochlamys debaryana]|uniref:Protein kinase domain-containing protein n=1 Tax=Edaphochlamys debaryana TaxID=47281 RepID=A0A835Y305_9CHLO|nr:hypothetical protein HYH03_010001 [Edaphochlamys debaryana]|eukprot:KAG2491630.1 hypothetical protein HYH03_010001 [Edaphochlamys debaryana]
MTSSWATQAPASGRLTTSNNLYDPVSRLRQYSLRLLEEDLPASPLGSAVSEVDFTGGPSAGAPSSAVGPRASPRLAPYPRRHKSQVQELSVAATDVSSSTSCRTPPAQHDPAASGSAGGGRAGGAVSGGGLAALVVAARRRAYCAPEALAAVAAAEAAAEAAEAAAEAFGINQSAASAPIHTGSVALSDGGGPSRDEPKRGEAGLGHPRPDPQPQPQPQAYPRPQPQPQPPQPHHIARGGPALQRLVSALRVAQLRIERSATRKRVGGAQAPASPASGPQPAVAAPSTPRAPDAPASLRPRLSAWSHAALPAVAPQADSPRVPPNPFDRTSSASAASAASAGAASPLVPKRSPASPRDAAWGAASMPVLKCAIREAENEGEDGYAAAASIAAAATAAAAAAALGLTSSPVTRAAGSAWLQSHTSAPSLRPFSSRLSPPEMLRTALSQPADSAPEAPAPAPAPPPLTSSAEATTAAALPLGPRAEAATSRWAAAADPAVVTSVAGAIPVPAGPPPAEDELGGGAEVATRLLWSAPHLPEGMDRPVWQLDDYAVSKRLYKGASSAVYRATCLHSGYRVALKVYFLSHVSTGVMHMIQREMEIHAGAQHPNIIKLYGAFVSEKHLVLVMEYATRGDLFGITQRHQLNELQITEVVMRPLISALSFLHAKGICHRDIKPENVFFTSDWTLKLADFGVSIDLIKERAVTRTGTDGYMAPEVCRCPLKAAPEDNKQDRSLAYGSACDVWALGVLSYELLVGFTPLPDPQAGPRPELQFPASASPACRAFTEACLAEDPSDRPSAMKLMRHEWLSQQRRYRVVATQQQAPTTRNDPYGQSNM